MIVNILIGLVGLGLVVLVHEAGHLLMSRAVGVDVEVFSVGWGKKLFGYKSKQTEYRISMLPIGGYVRLKGMDAYRSESALADNKIPDIEGGFFHASPLQRILIAIGGPLANLVAAMIILSCINLFGYNFESYDTRIVLASEIDGNTYPADQAKLQSGDRVLAINGAEVQSFADIREAIAVSEADALDIDVLRAADNTRERVKIAAETGEGGIPQVGIYPWIDPVVMSVEQNSAADIAGIMAGDVIAAVDGNQIGHALDITMYTADKRSVAMDIDRDGTRYQVSVVLGGNESDIGIMFAAKTSRRQPLRLNQAVSMAVGDVGRVFSLTFRGLRLLFGGSRVTDSIAGPIQLTTLVGEATSSGSSLGIAASVRLFFNFIALLSVALAIMNLLPIPILDGGQVVLYSVEAAFRRPLTPKVLTRYQSVGFVVICGLFLLAIVSDVQFLFGG